HGPASFRAAVARRWRRPRADRVERAAGGLAAGRRPDRRARQPVSAGADQHAAGAAAVVGRALPAAAHGPVHHADDGVPGPAAGPWDGGLRAPREPARLLADDGRAGPAVGDPDAAAGLLP